MKTIELLLTQNVGNLGIIGDVVKVRPGYARNFLLPRQMATKPTPGAIERLADRRKEVEAELAKLRSEHESLVARLNHKEFTLERAANEQGVLFGGVSQHEIAELLRSEGFDVEDRFVRVGEQIKRLDSYEIPVVIDKDLKTTVKLWVVSDKPADELEGDADEADVQTAVEEEVSQDTRRGARTKR